MFWQITATIHRINDSKWNHSKSVPTFFLDADMLGIVDQHHALKIASSIIDPFEMFTVNMCAILVNREAPATKE